MSGNKMALDALMACPFCGKSNTLVIGKASDVFAEPDECGDPLPYMHTESYAVTCDASKPDGPGGCGASGGYKLTEELAVAAWNERAAIAALQAEPQPEHERNAARLAFMQKQMLAADFDYDGECVLVFQWPRSAPVGADLIRNIDAALLATPPKD